MFISFSVFTFTAFLLPKPPVSKTGWEKVFLPQILSKPVKPSSPQEKRSDELSAAPSTQNHPKIFQSEPREERILITTYFFSWTGCPWTHFYIIPFYFPGSYGDIPPWLGPKGVLFSSSRSVWSADRADAQKPGREGEAPRMRANGLRRKPIPALLAAPLLPSGGNSASAGKVAPPPDDNFHTPLSQGGSVTARL